MDHRSGRGSVSEYNNVLQLDSDHHPGRQTCNVQGKKNYSLTKVCLSSDLLAVSIHCYFQDAWMPWNSTTNRQAAPPSPSSNRPIRTALRRHAASESQKSRAISNSESPPSNHHIATPSSTSRTPSSDSHKPRAVASSSRLIPPATPQGRTSDTQKRNAVFSRKQTISSAAGNSDASKNGVVSAKHSPAGSCK